MVCAALTICAEAPRLLLQRDCADSESICSWTDVYRAQVPLALINQSSSQGAVFAEIRITPPSQRLHRHSLCTPWG